MKVNWIVLAIVAAVCFFIPGGFLASSSDHSGAGMAALGFLFLIVPVVLIGAAITQVFLLNTRFRAYPAYVLIGIISSVLGVLFLVQ